MKAATRATLSRSDFDALFTALEGRGYQVVGPTVRDGAIVYDVLHGSAGLPAGWTDTQAGGRYELKRRDDAALFGYVVGPHTWKKYLHPPALTLWRAHREGAGFTLEPAEPPPPPLALLGVRPCELHAILVQDRVLLAPERGDPAYAARRSSAFIVAVNCTAPGGTCFCASMGTGPQAQAGFDLLLTELLDAGGHRFLLEAGSERGEEVAAELPRQPAPAADVERARAALEAASGRMGRTLDTDGLQELLYRRYEDAHWDAVGSRCLACTNCTQACPTCFCTTIEDRTTLGNGTAERQRLWDSCFTLNFSYIHGGSVRTSPGARYRQWITHKLGTWHEQFGVSGCVGCGRCITWCPVGIDVTEEVQALRRSESRGR
jgi:formate hydrogenlyase subunit 6/NADH:ubiquinone oxidoreductase subunit I